MNILGRVVIVVVVQSESMNAEAGYKAGIIRAGNNMHE